jgi:propionate CoA-transferase
MTCESAPDLVGSLPISPSIPAPLVDCVVVAAPEHHWQTFGAAYTPAYSGELRIPLSRHTRGRIRDHAGARARRAGHRLPIQLLSRTASSAGAPVTYVNAA